MAYIEGIEAGLVPRESDAHAERVAATKANKPQPAPMEVICEVCQGQVGFVTARKTPRNPCQHCASFFGLQSVPGVTDEEPEDALERMAKLREAQWGMLLINRTFSAVNATAQVTVEMGDVFQIQRAGDADLMDMKQICSRERTWGLFTAEIQIGPHKLTLFPHEISPIQWLTIMELKKAGELVEQFVSTNDRHGHFTPRDDLRAEIKECFGHMG